MPLRFVIGRSGTGKTGLCLQEIRELLSGSPDGPPLIMLVPEQATFQTEYALLRNSDLRGTMRAQALSFRRLAFRVMQETGGTSLVPIGDTGKHMLLYKIVHREATRLQLFKGGAEQPGFIDRLAELLTEWKRYGVDASSLQEATGMERNTAMLDRKLHDLALIYDGMESELAGKYIDAEDYLRYLETGYKDAPSMRDAQIWVDGFHGFTPTEFQALRALMQSSALVTVAITLDKPYALGEAPHELDLFHPTAETFLTLLGIAEEDGVPLLPTVNLNDRLTAARFRDNPMLGHLERHFGGKRVPMIVQHDGAGISKENQENGISLHAAASRRAEVEAVARDMLRRAREDGIRWRDMSVMVRNAEDYADYVSLVFDEYDIPFFVDRKEKALHHPLVEFIRSALETVLFGWRYDAVFRCIKTEMMFPADRSIPREWFDRLENFALAAGIDGWKWLDRKCWKPQMTVSLEEDAEIETVSTSAQREFDIVMEARESVVPHLRRFGEGLRKAESVGGMCEALFRLLDHTDAADRLERWSGEDMAAGRTLRARSHRQLWDNVMSLLDQLVELAGTEKVTPTLFAGMVEAGLDSLTLAAVPPALDQVLVGSMDRTRSRGIAVCYVLGANDGVIPMRAKEDGLLTEAERDTLGEAGLSMAPSVKRRLLDERFMVYNALTTPSRHLWISWTLADEEGKSLLPSELIRQVKGLFPGLSTLETAAEPAMAMPDGEQKTFVAHPRRTLSYLIGAIRQTQQEGADIPAFWWDVYNWYAVRPDWQNKLSMLTASLFYKNEELHLPEVVARELYGSRMQVSVSRMERFVSCPFQHFAVHGLKLRERKLYRLGAPDVGQLFHAALSKLAGSLGGGWGKMSRADIKAAAARTVDDLAPKLQSQILLSSGRFGFIARKLKEIVAQVAVVLGEHARRADFRPVGLEIDFGPGGALPPMVLSLPNGAEMEVIGRIDRVDAAETENGLLLRVMDYKSSSTSLKLEEVVHGLSLQMLTYLDVLVTYADRWLGQPASPAGVLYFHVHNPVMAMSNRISADEASGLLLKRYKTKGLLSADAEIIRLMDDELETGFSEVLPVALKKDGSFYSSSSVVTNEQWTALRGSVRRTISRIGGSIQEGKVSIEPYRLGDKSPCQFCDYKPVCQFDSLGNEYRKLAKTNKEETWRLLEEG
ncbi:helicase-exonuclease AddAB subunit AddB [Paenibacillus sp. LHD-117]|uniref:helicase-exonuclease AddAB subunit AddB n=1 Tax=Paenibacillus sp. LHD-117 TaxID=3071412 RepID=UPI0027DFFEB7|nr:helicase-exonuclease AddAB subunit AddB [Paenibacillus sp. LHD-117]MDQ6421125.1 helicase-exonuclease AddAB subunit AddB [Paenibacillus sp. LHD-117]